MRMNKLLWQHKTNMQQILCIQQRKKKQPKNLKNCKHENNTVRTDNMQCT